jgi:hypothetical protein
MQNHRRAPVLALVLALLASTALTAESPLRSGLQAGERIPSAFQPLNVTGGFAGEEHCLVCEYGLNPVVMIFARDVSDATVRLLAQVDAATAKHKDNGLCSFAVFLGDPEALAPRLREIARKNDLKHLVLSSMENPAGPKGYKVAREADLTVVLYQEHLVQANHAFKKGELKDKAIETILADLPRILPKK